MLFDPFAMIKPQTAAGGYQPAGVFPLRMRIGCKTHYDHYLIIRKKSTAG
jgi:hypothetical protein